MTFTERKREIERAGESGREGGEREKETDYGRKGAKEKERLKAGKVK